MMWYNLDSTQMAVALEQWRKTRTGPLAMNGLSDHVGFLRVSDGEALASFGDPAPGPNSPHYGYTPIVRPQFCISKRRLLIRVIEWVGIR